MKKVLTVLIAISVAFSLCAIPNSYSESMGLASISMTDTDVLTFVNPAQTFFYDNSHAFEIGISGSDNLGKGLYSDPEFDLVGVFAARRIAVGFSTAITTDQSSPLHYSIQKDFNLDISAALGTDNFAIGAGVTVGSSKIRSEIETLSKNKGFNLTKDAFFEEFRRLSDSQFVSIRAGLDYRYKNFSFGFVLNDIVTNSEANMKELLKQWGKGMNAGISWQSDKFSDRGRVKPLVFSAGVEGISILSSDASLNVGLDATLQLMRDYTVSVRTGFNTQFNDFSKASQVVSVGARINIVDCSVSVILPYEKTDDLFVKANVTVLI